ncbi:serine O-acetyltransferase EpsC [Anaerohalosphaeraceae bacterium U12dextr]
MSHKSFDSKQIDSLTQAILASYQDDMGTNFIDVKNLPVRDKILFVLNSLMELLFPGYTGKRPVSSENIRSIVQEILVMVRRELAEQIELALRFNCKLKECPACDCRILAGECCEKLLNQIPEIRQMLKEDVQAAFDGDPAAKAPEEIVLSYPHLCAIAIHRVAHELYRMDIPLIPRMMAEYAHSQTGIDIHPGAQVGRRFFIDHGTGVVIGETAVIGNNVKIYQGVTLGAVSFPKDEHGNIIRGKKRHPTLEDDVTVYAEATILGDIVIGKGAVIGGNVWIRESVPPGAVVTIAKPESLYVTRGRRKTAEKNSE